MKLFASFCMAFRMYTRFPVPSVEWKEENMDLMFCFFPGIGLAVGAVVWVVWRAGMWLGPEGFLLPAVLTVLPLLLTGKIHMDGYMDTLDALGSWGEQKRKLEILKDSHTGAFAVIGCGIWLLVCFGGWTEISSEKQVICIWMGYILSRALSGFSVVTFPKAGQKSSTVAVFSQAANKRIVKVTIACWFFVCAAAGIWLCGWMAAAAVIVLLAVFGYYWNMSRAQFGGITGDLAGYFLQVGELAVLLAAALGKGW